MTRRLDVKIVLMLLFTALVPLSVSVYLVAEAVNTSLDVGLNEEIAEQIKHFAGHDELKAGRTARMKRKRWRRSSQVCCPGITQYAQYG